MLPNTNPSHLLISRNPPRSPAHPQLAHASTSRHSHSHTNLSSSPLPSPLPSNFHPYPYHQQSGLGSDPHQMHDRVGGLGLSRWNHSADDLSSASPAQRVHSTSAPYHQRTGINGPRAMADDSENDDGFDARFYDQEGEEEVIVVHPTFSPDARMPGKVKVIVGRNEFWCHKDVLWFASPFFQGLLNGSWAETTRLPPSSNSPSTYTYAFDVSPSLNRAPSIGCSAPSSPPTDTDPPSPRNVSMPAPTDGVPPEHPVVHEEPNSSTAPQSSMRAETSITRQRRPLEPWSSAAEDRIALGSGSALGEHACTDDIVLSSSGSSIHGGGRSRKESIYLDATDDQGESNLSLADILRELRELPETPSGGVRNIADVLEESDAGPTLSEVLAGSTRIGTVRREVLQSAVQPQSMGGNQALTQLAHLQRGHQHGEAQDHSDGERLDSQSEPLCHPSVEETLRQDPPYISDSTTGRSRRGPRRESRHRSTIRHSFSSSIARGTDLRRDKAHGQNEKTRRNHPEVVVEFHEESASAFQDFLFWAYPHLECKVTWTNVENLLALSLKLIVPALQKQCEHFLMTHASGRPVMALALAEEHGNAELFREASRFVLDQPTWDHIEMEALSDRTQLKLSKRRNWFLERLLKLGSIDVKKEYTCRADCPDPARCQAQLDEKWRQAHSAVCRYGPPQPSVAFRCLRQLETFPTNPSLVMSHPLCQNAAKTWVMSLFDRMFQPKLIFSASGTDKYWLFITMD